MTAAGTLGKLGEGSGGEVADELLASCGSEGEVAASFGGLAGCGEEAAETVVEDGAFLGFDGKGFFEFLSGPGGIVLLEADYTKGSVGAGAECGDGSGPFVGRNPARGFRGSEQDEGTVGGALGAVEIIGTVGEQVGEFDEQGDIIRGNSEAERRLFHGPVDVALGTGGAGHQFRNREQKGGLGEGALESNSLFENGAIEDIEIGIVLLGGFCLQVGEELRV